MRHLSPDPAVAKPDMPRRPLWRRMPNRAALAVALLIHLLILLSVLRLRTAAPAAPIPEARLQEVVISLVKPPPEKRAEPASAGVKLAARPSVGLPVAKTRERKLATLPIVELTPEVRQAALPDALPQLSAIDAAATTVGSGGTGSTGSGAGATGRGSGTGKLFEDCADTPDRPMVADVYRLPVGTDSLTEMDWRKPVRRVCMAQLDVKPRPFREGFPGMGRTIEWFGLDVRFTVRIAEAGSWVMMLLSDDGAALSIDGVEVLNNDGQHSASTATTQLRLTAGVHNFRVRYFQGPRENIALTLTWKKPGQAEFDYLPRQLLGRPPAAGLATLHAQQ